MRLTSVLLLVRSATVQWPLKALHRGGPPGYSVLIPSHGPGSSVLIYGDVERFGAQKHRMSRMSCTERLVVLQKDAAKDN